MEFYHASKHYWRSTWLNSAAAAANIVIWINNIYHGGWMGWLNMIAAAVSIWFARDAYRKYREAVEDEKKFVVEALSGKFG
jgi:hypothetical protein